MRVMKSNYLWTGGEASIASKVGKPFVYTAETTGIVESISNTKIVINYSSPKKENVIFVNFDITSLKDLKMSILINNVSTYLNTLGYRVTTDNKEAVKYKVYIGKSDNKNVITVDNLSLYKTQLKTIVKAPMTSYKKTYSLRSWASKIEGNQSLKHNMTTNLKVNQSVIAGDVLVYDDSYFEPNIYDSKSIILKMGATYRIAFVENKTTYEDSTEISSKVLGDTGEVKYKILSKVIDTTSHITNVIPEGSKVTYGDKLMTILDNTLLIDKTLTDKAKEILSEASDSSPTANANGVIDRIDVIYNCELDDMDASIRELADISNKRFKDELGTDGRVTKEYSIAGVPLAPNQIELKYYISYSADTKIGDKFVVGHQLKCTVGTIRTDITTEDGEPVDFIFSNKSVLARITNSSYIVGAVNILMADIIKEAVTAYRK